MALEPGRDVDQQAEACRMTLQAFQLPQQLADLTAQHLSRRTRAVERGVTPYVWRDGKDLSFVTLSVVDASGKMVGQTTKATSITWSREP